MAKFRDRVPAYIYLHRRRRAAQGACPAAASTPRAEIISYWQGQRTFVDGLTQETCRDFTHTGYGISADLARRRDHPHPGPGPLPGGRRAAAAGARASRPSTSWATASPSWLCGGTLKPRPRPGHRGRLQRPAQPAGHRDDQHAAADRAAAARRARNNLFVAWETLTHAEQPRLSPTSRRAGGGRASIAGGARIPAWPAAPRRMRRPARRPGWPVPRPGRRAGRAPSAVRRTRPC